MAIRQALLCDDCGGVCRALLAASDELCFFHCRHCGEITAEPRSEYAERWIRAQLGEREGAA